jgi:hypothetical protein
VLRKVAGKTLKRSDQQGREHISENCLVSRLRRFSSKLSAQKVTLAAHEIHPASTDRIDPSVEFRMVTIRLADLDAHSLAASPLDDRLLNLNSDSDDPSRVAEFVESADPSPQFDSWKVRFESNRDKITRRLAVIEAEFDRMDVPGGSPKLGVYGGHH